MENIQQVISNILDDSVFGPLIYELSIHDRETYQHSIRMAKLAYGIYEEKGYSYPDCVFAAKAGLLHDIGVLKVNRNIIDNKGYYTKEEYQEMKKHTKYGYDLLGKYGVDEELRKVCLCHHERLNGNGYPCGLQKKDIPEIVQMISFLEVFVSYTSEKSYRKKYSYWEAINIMEAYDCGEFDMKYSNAVFRLYDRKILLHDKDVS